MGCSTEIPQWLITILSFDNEESFSFSHSGKCRLSINGIRANGIWRITFSAYSMSVSFGGKDIPSVFKGNKFEVLLHWVGAVLKRLPYNKEEFSIIRTKLIQYERFGM